jgi:hypothetical protein
MALNLKRSRALRLYWNSRAGRQRSQTMRRPKCEDCGAFIGRNQKCRRCRI